MSMTRDAPPPAIGPVRVAIQLGRSSKDWRVVDAETGRPLYGVVSIAVTADVRTKEARAVIELLAFDITAEVEATARRCGLDPEPRPKRETPPPPPDRDTIGE